MSNECFLPVLVHEFLQRSARLHPAKTALVFQNERLSYEELDRKSSDLAVFLKRNCLHHQDRVVVFSDNCTEAVVAIYGILKAGCVFVLLNGSTKALGWRTS